MEEKVAVEGEETPDGSLAAESVAKVRLCEAGEDLHAVAHEQGADDECEPGPLGDHSAEGDTAVAYAAEASEAKGKDDAGRHIRKVDYEVGYHRIHSVLHADEPAFESEEGERRRRCPYPYAEISRSEYPDRLRAVHHQEGQLEEHALESYQQHSGEEGKGQRPEEDAAFFVEGAGGGGAAEGLGGEPAGAGAEEIEAPEEKVEKYRAYRDAADERRRGEAFLRGNVAEMACDGYIDKADERNRQVGENARDGEAEYFPVERPVHQRNLPSSSSMPR